MLNCSIKTAYNDLQDTVHEKITNKEYMLLNSNITVRTAFNDLNDMIKKGIMKSSGEKKYRYYKLA